MNKLSFAFAGLFLILAGCAKTGEQGPLGPTGPQGPIGPVGPGYSELVIQPGPDDAIGKDLDISASSGNRGTSPSIGFGYEPSGAGVVRALYYFNVSQAGLPAGATVVDAILTLYPQFGAASGNLITGHIYPVLKDWSESACTWTAATSTVNWAAAGGDYNSTSELGSFTVDPTTTAKVDIHLDATYVQNWVNGQVNYGFMIKSDQESGLDRIILFYSSDYSVDATKRPSLKLIYK